MTFSLNKIRYDTIPPNNNTNFTVLLEFENKKDKIKARHRIKVRNYADLGRMAELVDALGSGLSVRKNMGVQVPLRPPVKI